LKKKEKGGKDEKEKKEEDDLDYLVEETQEDKENLKEKNR
jgi:hypothetical protein